MEVMLLGAIPCLILTLALLATAAAKWHSHVVLAALVARHSPLSVVTSPLSFSESAIIAPLLMTTRLRPDAKVRCSFVAPAPLSLTMVQGLSLPFLITPSSVQSY